ncbi:MAG: FGGY-family carbohydrate kinase [Planctomycetia bacterium]|nr:FGGY-family carbohydrate kinase [Planctomycetia bacterium]
MILALDLGSTALKAAVFDPALRQRAAASCPLEYRFAPGGRVELDADAVIAAVQQVLRGAIDRAGVPVEAIRALAITSQAQTFTVVDSRGEPRIPLISWQDTRAGETLKELTGDPAFADFARHASFGQPLDALQVCQIRHLQRTRPGLIEPADQVLKLPALLVRRLTGAAVIDRNLAAMSGLYSLVLEDWWPAALAVCGLQPGQLPTLVPIGVIAAKTDAHAADLGLPPGVPVVLAGNDQTAGAFGARLDEQGGLLITLGTAQVAYACHAVLAPADPAVIRGPYPGGLYYRMAADSCGGSIINWAKTVLAGCETDEAFFAAAGRAEPGCGGLAFEAELPSGHGAWRNIGFEHRPAEFARAVVECLAGCMARMIAALDVDLTKTKVLAAGGGSRSEVWVSILSEKLGRPILATEADPAAGAARMAKIAIGD